MKHLFSRNSIVLLLCILTGIVFFFRYGKEYNILHGDALGYYSYLPSAFIYHNFTSIEVLPEHKNIPGDIREYFHRNLSENKRSPKGYYINQYTYGIALMELPFFAIAHSIEWLRGGEANGYSLLYKNMIRFSGFMYLLIGLLLLYDVLRKYFRDRSSMGCIALLLIGTNLFWFTFFQGGMAHIPLFFLYALLIYLSQQLYQNTRSIHFFLVSLVCGLITVIRPSDVLCILIPLLFGIRSVNDGITRIQFIKNHVRQGLPVALGFILPILPQLIFWKMYAGSFLYDSYVNQSFDFRHPKIIEGLFGFSNGWLAYTPLMFFALFGMLRYKKTGAIFLPLLIILPLYVYIIYSWFCYTYINGLGSRPMIHMYPLLAFPLAASLEYIAERSIWIRSIAWFIISFFVFINLSYSIHAATGDLRSEQSNYVYNFGILFKKNLNYQDLVVLDVEEKQPDENKLTRSILLARKPFDEQPDGILKVQDAEYPDVALVDTLDKPIIAGKTYVKVSLRCNSPEAQRDMYRNQLLVLEIKRGDKSIVWKSIRINNKIGKDTLKSGIHLLDIFNGIWGQVYYYIKIPKEVKPGDRIHAGIWNLPRGPLWIDDIQLDLCYFK